MKRQLHIVFAATLMFLSTSTGWAFSLLGPFKTVPDPWQLDGYAGRPQGLGYSLAGDIGGPMFLFEAYRWNIPTITYAFDQSFFNYFGPNGVNAIESAISIFNDLPPATQMSGDLSEYPLDTKQRIEQISTLGLLDLKSHCMPVILEQLGLANPERFVYGLRGRSAGQAFTNYSVIKMNYDPITLQPSSFVNGQLYGYGIVDDIGPQGAEWASAVEYYYFDPFVFPYTSVAGGLGSPDLQFGDAPFQFTGAFLQGLASGEFFFGLTRDDVGGLRYLLNTNLLAVESLLPTITNGIPVTGGVTGSPWTPFFANTNVFAGQTNAITNLTGTLIVTGIRPGVNKITFRRINFDSLIGQTITPFTNRFTDTVISNSRPIIQPVQRTVTFPDLLFLSADLGVVQSVPVLISRSTTTNWVNNDAINGNSTLGGPGVIQPPIRITFSDVLPYGVQGVFFDPFFLTDVNAIFFTWASFDGETEPIIYPEFLGITLEDIQQTLFFGGGP